MKNFHFHFEGARYNAQATITSHNGRIDCNISNVIAEGSGQQVKFQGFEMGPLEQNELPVTKAISLGLQQYLKNFPVDHK